MMCKNEFMSVFSQTGADGDERGEERPCLPGSSHSAPWSLEFPPPERWDRKGWSPGGRCIS